MRSTKLRQASHSSSFAETTSKSNKMFLKMLDQPNVFERTWSQKRDPIIVKNYMSSKYKAGNTNTQVPDKRARDHFIYGNNKKHEQGQNSFMSMFVSTQNQPNIWKINSTPAKPILNSRKWVSDFLLNPPVKPSNDGSEIVVPKGRISDVVDFQSLNNKYKRKNSVNNREFLSRKKNTASRTKCRIGNKSKMK